MRQSSFTVLPMKKSLLRKTIRQQATALAQRDSDSLATASEVICEKISEWLSKKMANHPKRENIPLCTSSSPVVSHPPKTLEMTDRNSAPRGASPRFLSSSCPSLCIGAYWAFSSEVSLEPLLENIWSWRVTGCERNREEERRNSKMDNVVSYSGNDPKQEAYHKEDRKSESRSDGLAETISFSPPKATTRMHAETKEVAVFLPVVVTKDIHHYLYLALRLRQNEREGGKTTNPEELEEHDTIVPISSSLIACLEGPTMIMLEVFDRADFDHCFSENGGGDRGFRCRSVPKEKLTEIFLSDGVQFITRPPQSVQEGEWKKGRTGEETPCPFSEDGTREACTGTTFSSPSEPADHQKESASGAVRRVWLCDDWNVLFPGCAIPTPAFATDSFTPHPVELVLLTPGLGFTREGDRLGKGGGFYDRFIKFYRQNSLESNLLRRSTTSNFVIGATPLALEFQTVGVGFDFQLVDAGTILMEEHDEVMSAVLTPSFSSLRE